MKIAATYENGQIFQHFGHTEQFKVYEVENSEIVSSEVIGTNGSGHGALAGLLHSGGIDVLVCGGIGGGAVQALTMAGIKLCAGVSGDADAAVKALIDGKLTFADTAVCNHHEGQHSCGEHSCGTHTCGH